MVILVPLLVAATIVSVNALQDVNTYRFSQTKDLIPRSPLQAAQASSGCVDTYPDWFMLTATDANNAKRGLSKRDCHEEGTLMTSIQNGVLTDVYGRTGCIVANFQFQFDGPPQAGTIYSSGWSVCDGKLNLGSQSVFWKCPSGRDNGEIFYNLYDRQWTGHCEPTYMEMLPCSGSTAPTPHGSSGQSVPMHVIPDGQPQIGKGAVGQIGDGQIQAPKGGKGTVGQIGDGQIQAPKGGKGTVGQIGDGQIQAPKGGNGAVGQIGDGQIQAPKGGNGAVGQIGDGQIQAPKGGKGTVGQIGDGQIQAPKGGNGAVGQIGDGQIQAPKGGNGAVGQIGDGQIQAPKGGQVTQIGDGQIQAPKQTPGPNKACTSSCNGRQPISVIPDGQPQAPSSSGSSSRYSTQTGSGNSPITVISDGQPQAPTSTGSASPTSTGKALNVIPDGQPQAVHKAIAKEVIHAFENIGAAAQIPVIMGGVLGAVAVVFG